MVRKGRFIVVEGLEGAGKSTAINTIKAYLSEHHITDVITTREPGGTRVGEIVRQLIKETLDDQPLDPRTELLLMYASRIQLVQQVIIPALDRGCWVVGDRFELSTWAYQGGGRGLDPQMIAHLSSFCLQDFKPDLTLFLDINPSQGLKRVKKRGALDRIEQESLDFFMHVREAYHAHIKTQDHVVVIDAGNPLDQVQRAIQAALFTTLFS